MISMKTKHIEVLPCNPDWPCQFEEEAAVIKKALQDNLIAIHHIGSTSSPGLAAKPIIDMIIVVQYPLWTISALETVGYLYRGEMGIPFRHYFNKKQGTTVHLHIYEEGNPEIELNILFRDYLRAHEKEHHEYAQLKEDLLTQEDSFVRKNGGFSGYTLGKDVFIKKILQRAGFNKLRLMHCTHDEEWEEYHRIREEQIFRGTSVIYDRQHPSLTAQSHHHFILYKGTTIVAVAHVEFLNMDEAALRSLATDDPYTKCGYASHMLNLLEKWIKRQGRRVIKIHAALSAEQFYRKLEYEAMTFDDLSISQDSIDLGKIL